MLQFFHLAIPRTIQDRPGSHGGSVEAMSETVMMSHAKRAVGADFTQRDLLVRRALILVSLSVAWGLVAGTWSITAGLLAGSLGVLGLGFNVMADVAGSASLIWRFRRERSDPGVGDQVEARASVVVAAALIVTATVLTTASIHALVEKSAPDNSNSAMLAAAAAFVVLAPLGLAKHRAGSALSSNALKGDGTLSGIGAFLGAFALIGLLVNRSLGWWWADRIVALVGACIAAGEAARVIRHRPARSR
jgi:divalent metal cation (Fe/Co/Zn/Cd) transporter